jgi:hypothetical protein
MRQASDAEPASGAIRATAIPAWRYVAAGILAGMDRDSSGRTQNE